MLVKLKTLAAGALAFAFIAGTAGAAQLGADRHKAAGVPCAACHGENIAASELPTSKQCTACHAPDVLADKTAKLPGANPHKAPHNGDCTVCHRQHEEAVDYCAQCHQFNFAVP